VPKKIPALFNTRASVLALLKEKDDEIAAIQARHIATVHAFGEILGAIGRIYVEGDKWMRENGYVKPASEPETTQESAPQAVA